MRVAWAFVMALAACSSPSEITDVDAAVGDDAAMLDASPDAAVATEMRGVWVTRFAYSTQAQLEAIIDRAADAHFNAVFFQIRGEGDAYYASAYEPWARRLTGTLGRTPTWDPLRAAIDRAHARGIQLHAYFNVFSAWPASSAPTAAEGSKPHALFAHPAWLAVNPSGVNTDAEYKWFTPGNLDVRAHIVDVATDLLAHYEVDGLHLDRIRVPAQNYSHDAVTQARFDAAKALDTSLTFDDFMRDQVTAMVAELHAAVNVTRPSAKLSAAVWGIYKPIAGCGTSQGLRDFHQDSLGWMSAGIIDAIAPMMYWSIEPGACTDWATLAHGFIAARAGRQIWAGMHALDDDAWDFAQVRARIELARADGAQGTMVYASAYLDADPTRWSAFLAPGVFATPMPAP